MALGSKGGSDVGLAHVLCQPTTAYPNVSNLKAKVQDSMPRNKSKSKVESQGVSIEL